MAEAHFAAAAGAVEYLYSLQKFGIKMGLESITSIMAVLGNPHLGLRVIHVAGTNGKGSTSSFIASVLQAFGFKVGLYTSPHLVDFTERIKINGRPISAREVVDYTNLIRPLIDPLNGTFFEATTAMALQAFADHRVDVAVIETGLGGRLDSTNVVVPTLSVITSIDLEHTEYLGSTLEAIASEKAGIIKPGHPVLSAVLQDEAREVIRARAAELGVAFHELGKDTPEETIHDVDRMEFHYPIQGAIRHITVPLVGSHQVRNALLAIKVVELGTRQARVNIVGPILEGLAEVRERTGLRGRLERLSSEPDLVCDVAHNPSGFHSLFATWVRLREPSATHLVFGLSKSKDLDSILEEIRQHPWKSITAVGFDSPELFPVDDLVARGESAGLAIRDGGDVRAGVEHILAVSASTESVLLCGSHYVVGRFLTKEISKTT
jgi:dihydrofolate synthase / folylpolyglutamate synthase